jgi:hypothetical protein
MMRYDFPARYVSGDSSILSLRSSHHETKLIAITSGVAAVFCGSSAVFHSAKHPFWSCLGSASSATDASRF